MKLDKDDIESIKLFYEYTRKPNVTPGDCWQYLIEFVGVDACLDGLNLVSGEIYNHFLPVSTVGELDKIDHNYVKQTGLYNYRQAQNACRTSRNYPKALSMIDIRRHAHAAVKKLSATKEA